jgi:hypothetical protein
MAFTRRPGFDPVPVHVRCMVKILTLWQVLSSQYFRFPLSVSFHQCSILIFMYSLLLPEGEMGEAWKPFGNRGIIWSDQCLYLVFECYKLNSTAQNTELPNRHVSHRTRSEHRDITVKQLSVCGWNTLTAFVMESSVQKRDVIHDWQSRHTVLTETSYSTDRDVIQYWQRRHTVLTEPSYSTDRAVIQYWQRRHTVLTETTYSTDRAVIQYWQCRHTVLTEPAYSTDRAVIQYWQSRHTVLRETSYSTDRDVIQYWQRRHTVLTVPGNYELLTSVH